MTSTIPPTTPPIRLALIGAGIFARDVHLRALQALAGTYEIIAVCSRTKKSASSLASMLPKQPDIYTDIPALLTRDDIDALDILVPIDVMPHVLEMALASGKHVISEKPLAPDFTTGRRLLEIHKQNTYQVWMVAENWRYEPVFFKAAQVLKSGTIGKPLLCHWADHFYITPANKYYHTAWRQAATFPGGYLLDGGIHRIAVLRMVLGEIDGISAVVTQVRSDLPPADTLHATLRFKNGVTGSYAFTVAVKAPWSTSLYIVGESGSIEVNRFTLKVTQGGQTQEVSVARPSDWYSIYAELDDFAAAIYQQQPIRNTPQQGLQDVAVIEAMLQAARLGQYTVPEHVV